MTDFVHLHVHSAYSLRESTLRIEDMLDAALEHGMNSVALTDTCALYGAGSFYARAKAANVKPIFGTQIQIAADASEHVQLRGREPRKTSFDTVVLLAKNFEGYQALCRLITTARARGHLPHVTLDELSRDATDLFCLIGGGESALLRGFAEQDLTASEQWLSKYLSAVPTGQLYVDVQDHERPFERRALPGLIQTAKSLEIPLVVTGDVHYRRQEDASLQRAYAGLDFPDAAERWESELYHFASKEEMVERFRAFPEAIANTSRIADACFVDLPMNTVRMPLYPTKDGRPTDAVLRDAARAGAKQRYSAWQEEIETRLNYELDVICDMGYADYFLVVADFIRFAHQSGISTGPGRGSAAGSLVAYALRITDVDPLENQLLFERFLNPARVSLPDIDTDFEYERRGEVIQYVVEKYGSDRVAQIGTFGTLAARAAVRDAGRMLGADGRVVDKIAKMIPGLPGTTLTKARAEVRPLADMLETTASARVVYETAQALEGLPHHTSVHAAGVVISPDPLTDLMPLEPGADGTHVTQYAMAEVEALGLVKMDFLGLRTLTLVDETVASVKRRTGIVVDWRKVPVDDEPTYQMLTKAQTAGVFQLESSGMRRVLRQLRPSTMEDIVAVNALMRPGPMENIPEFCDAKHGRKPIRYLHPDLEPILKDTYGVIVYQEQIMQIASRIAGFTLGQADLLRRAVSKKKREVLDEERDRFVEGCLNNGYEKGTASDLYNLIVRFADYGFNRSHAVAYAVLAFRTAYLRRHYLPDFLAALMTMATGSADKVKTYTDDALQNGLQVKPPSVSESERGYSVDVDGQIRTGLLAVRNVGITAVDCILQAREEQRFTSLRDFLGRVNARIVNKKALESLLAEGAFDEFFPSGVAHAAKAQMFDEANKLAEEDRQFTGLGLLLDEHVSANDRRVSSPVGKEDYAVSQEVLYIRYSSQNAGRGALREVQSILASSTGDVPVALHDTSTRKTRQLGDKWNVALSPELLTLLEDVFGIGNVKVSYRKKRA